jgi:hypothetical protein
MTIAELKQEIVDELTIELRGEPTFDAELLEVKVKSAIRDVKTARKYPANYTEALIETDLARFESQIKAIALYDYTKIGAEGQKNYSADGESINYMDRDAMFAGVIPISGVM